jgi:predicted nucleotidyltransferase
MVGFAWFDGAHHKQLDQAQWSNRLKTPPLTQWAAYPENIELKKILYLADMLTRAEIENKLIQIKPELADKFHVSRIGYFGSFAHDKQNENSDLDLLVEFSKPIGWEFFTLEQFLEKSFGIPIDLVTRNALKDRIKESILTQVRYI